MSDTPSHYFSDHIHHLFAELNPEDVEQFYSSYQRWLHQQQITSLQAKIHSLQRHIAENSWRMQQVHPSPIALAILARLQSKGVTDIELLDRLLERGEIWLDQTMQHLEYCEQLDFMRDNYTEWCRHALDGAYDWIDSIHDEDNVTSPSSSVEDTLPSPLATGEPLNEATEETLLQKLMSEGVEEEEAASMLETTLKIPVVSPAEILETQALDTVPAIEEAQIEQHVEVAAPVEMAETEQTVETVAPIAPVEIAEAEQTVGDATLIAPIEIAEAEQPLETDVHLTEVEVDEAEQLQASAVSIEEVPEEQPQEEEAIIYFVDDLETLPLEILAEPVEQEAELEQADFVAMDEALLQVEASDDVDASFVPVEQTAELEHAEYVPTLEEYIPSDAEETGSAINRAPTEHEEVSPASEDEDTVPAVEVTGTSDSQLQVSEKGPIPALEAIPPVEANNTATTPTTPATVSHSHSNFAAASTTNVPIEEVFEDAWESEHLEFVPATVEPLPASNDAPWRWEDPLPSEVNTSDGQGTLESTQQSDAQVSQEAQLKPPQKRTFLQRLFAIFRRK